MSPKIRIGNYLSTPSGLPYGAFVEIDGKRCDNVRDIRVTMSDNVITDATITFTGVGFANSVQEND